MTECEIIRFKDNKVWGCNKLSDLGAFQCGDHIDGKLMLCYKCRKLQIKKVKEKLK